jgi:glyoxylase-like metal-dependent hydrolase (beta-lactamase superfamily II)
MAVKRVIEGVHLVPMGMANAFLVEGDDGLILIDAGYPGKEEAVFGAIRWLGRSPDQLEHLIFTHGHPDHIGSAAAIVRETGARTYMHPLDIPMGCEWRSFSAYAGGAWSVGAIDVQAVLPPYERLEPVAIDQPLTAGEILPIAGGFARDRSRCCGVPGQCCLRATCARTSWASVIPSALRI